jgi:hypothetical protein
MRRTHKAIIVWSLVVIGYFLVMAVARADTAAAAFAFVVVGLLLAAVGAGAIMLASWVLRRD